MRFSRSRREAHTGSRQLFAKVDFGLPRADFLSRVDLDLQASRMFRTTPRKKIWCSFVLSCSVRTLAYGTWLRSLINAPCLPGVDSGAPVQKQTRHHVACTAREGTLLWILAKLLVHALCLAWSRFGRSRREAHTASCQIFAKVDFGLPSCEIFISSRFGS